MEGRYCAVHVFLRPVEATNSGAQGLSMQLNDTIIIIFEQQHHYMCHVPLLERRARSQICSKRVFKHTGEMIRHPYGHTSSRAILNNDVRPLCSHREQMFVGLVDLHQAILGERSTAAECTATRGNTT
jgi:hypothetical protein